MLFHEKDSTGTQPQKKRRSRSELRTNWHPQKHPLARGGRCWQARPIAHSVRPISSPMRSIGSIHPLPQAQTTLEFRMPEIPDMLKALNALVIAMRPPIPVAVVAGVIQVVLARVPEQRGQFFPIDISCPCIGLKKMIPQTVTCIVPDGLDRISPRR